MSDPRVSIVLPIFNGARWLERCFVSVVEQTERDFELIVLDDGSSDATPEILARAARRDDRVRVVGREHRGLVACLNHGLELSTAPFVARIDADDWWAPNRLELQLAFLDANPEYGIVGSAIWHVDPSGEAVRTAQRPETDLYIRWKALIWCPFTHSAVLIRRRLLDQHDLRYDPRFEGAEDYDLWLRLLEVSKGRNLIAPLVGKRRHDSLSVVNAERVVPIRTEISRRAIRMWAPGFDVASSRELIDIRDVFHTMGRARLQGRPDAVRVTSRFWDLWESFKRGRGPVDGRDEEVAQLMRLELGRILADLEPSGDRLRLVRLVERLNRIEPGFRSDYWRIQWRRARARARKQRTKR